MPVGDRQRLKDLLEQLRGEKSKVLITSRSDEAWLGSTACFRIPLGGLQGEERWALADAMLADLRIKADRNDTVLAGSAQCPGRTSLMMRAILLRLGAQTAASLRQALEQYVPNAASADPAEQKLYATLRFIEDGLPPPLKPLLYPLGLHEGCVTGDQLAAVAQQAEQAFDVAATGRADVNRLAGRWSSRSWPDPATPLSVRAFRQDQRELWIGLPPPRRAA